MHQNPSQANEIKHQHYKPPSITNIIPINLKQSQVNHYRPTKNPFNKTLASRQSSPKPVPQPVNLLAVVSIKLPRV